MVLRVLPPIVTGPVIMVIGLILAPVAVHMALGKTGDGAVVLVPENTALWISMTSLAVTVLVSLLGKGFLRLMPILCGIAAGFIFYCITKICKGKIKEIHPILWVVTVLFILNFVLLALI